MKRLKDIVIRSRAILSGVASSVAPAPKRFVNIGHGYQTISEADFNPEVFKVMEFSGITRRPDLVGHLRRYFHTIANLPQIGNARGEGGACALELGTNYFMPLILLDLFRFSRVDFTDFNPNSEIRDREIYLDRDYKRRPYRSFNINLEHDPIPVPDNVYDLVLCFEVIEHLDLDPMFMLAEINRVLKPGGLVYISTPNSTSARNVMKILKGYAPHFYMQYMKDRSPYKHNIEYDPHQLRALVEAAGFRIKRFWTKDCFEEPLPEVMKYLSRRGHSTQDRGDNMFVIGEKISGVIERFPPQVYVD